MRTVSIIGLLLLGVAGSAPASTWADPEIQSWVEELAAPGLTAERREAIFNELQALASGELLEPRTAEAVLALAEFLPAERPIGHADDNVLGRMITLYPDDPRIANVLVRQARRHLAAKDAYGAHFMLTRLLTRASEGSFPELRIRAAVNAVAVGDMPSAMEWSSIPEGARLAPELEHAAWRARLTAAQALGRHVDAIEVLDRFEASDGTLAGDAAAMLAAARIEVAAGRLDAAETRYRDFVNIHTRSAVRPAAMLEHAELLARLQRVGPARRVLQWLIENYESAPEAAMARVRDVEWNPALSPADRVAAYRSVASTATTEIAAITACDDLLELLIAEGQPLAAVSALSWMIRHTRGFPAIAARRSLLRGAEPAIRLLVSRDDPVGIAAAASAIRAAGLPIPAPQRSAVAAARRVMGMTFDAPGLEQAEELARGGHWEQVNRLLAHVDRASLDDTAYARATALAAEALWRLGQAAAARDLIEQVPSTLELTPSSERPLIVLRADLEFAEGRVAPACVGYRAASALRETPYVADQLRHCEPAPGPGQETTP